MSICKGLDNLSPLVVGYKGEIGSFILQGLLRLVPKALNIWCFDINESEREKIARIKKSDLIFLCVPIQETVDWLVKYNKYLKGKTVIEQTSLKSILYKNKKLPIVKGYTLLSMHILFRPSSTPNKEDRSVALIDNINWETYINDIKIITDTSNIVVFKSWEDHDRSMAYNQALVHRVLLSLGDCLSGIRGETFVSKKVKELVERIENGDKVLYNIIQKNEFLPKKLEEFNQNLKDFDKLHKWVFEKG
jgi:prephenate dehydrogenase